MNRIKYIDTLKFAAMFAIVLLHISQVWVNVEFLNMKFINLEEIFRFGVPLFLLVTGALAFNKEIELGPFLKKKIVRLIFPLLFYLAVVYITAAYTSQYLIRFWYAWMALGVYFAIPVVNLFIRNASDREIEYFLVMFIGTSLLYRITYTVGINIAFDLNFFIGPISYVVLGYYLSRKEFKLSPNKMVLISLIVFIISSLYKIFYFDTFWFDRNFMLISYLNLSFTQILQAASVFLIIRYLYESSSGIFGAIRKVLENNAVNKFMLSTSRATYGIYFVHVIILRLWVQPNFYALRLPGEQTAILIVIISVCLFIISWLIVLILGKIPYIKTVSGYY